jgi:hypothetical protein
MIPPCVMHQPSSILLSTKNLSEFDVILHIDGLQDLSIPRMPTGNIKLLPRLSGLHLLACTTDKWIMIWGVYWYFLPAPLNRRGFSIKS